MQWGDERNLEYGIYDGGTRKALFLQEAKNNPQNAIKEYYCWFFSRTCILPPTHPIIHQKNVPIGYFVS